MARKVAEIAGRLVDVQPFRALLRQQRTHFLYLHNVPHKTWFRTLVADLGERFELVSYVEAVQRVQTGVHPRPALCFSFDDGFESSGIGAEIVAEAGVEACLFVCPEIVCSDRAGQDRLFGRPQSESTMTWTRIDALRSAGHQIGSHSMRHANLSEFESFDRLQTDIETSRRTIEKYVGDCDHFAWPLGRLRHVTPQVIDVARQSGFSSVASAVRGSHGGRSNPDTIILRHIVQPEQSLQSVLGHLALAQLGVDSHRAERTAIDRLAQRR